MSSATSASTPPSLIGGGKLTPNLDQRSTKMLNLTVLQRVDPFIEEILITAGHVTFYEFNIDLNQWSRKEVEGPLFVVKRNAQPRFQFIVMNRRNTENLVEDLMADFEYEIQVPYLLYRNNATQEVNGIWFYNSCECEEVANLFSRILNAYSKVAPKSQVTPSKSEFEELEAVPTSVVIDSPLEPSVTPAGSTMAMNTGHSSSNDVNSGQLYHNIAPTAPPSHVYGATPSHTLTQQGHSSSNDVNSGQLYHNIAPTAPPSHGYGATPSHTPTQQGHSSSNDVNSGQFYHNIAPTAAPSHVYGATPSHTPTQQTHSSSNDVNSGQFYHNIAPTAPSSHGYGATPSHTPTQQTHSSSNDVNSGQFYHNIAPTAAPSNVYGATPSHTPTQQVPSFPVTSPSIPSSTQNDVPNPVNNSDRTANLVKPSSFYTPPPSLLPYTPPMASSGGSTSALHPLLNQQSSHGTPMLQPFPPPTPPPSLTANPGPSAVNLPLNKEKVRDALLMLVQDDQFIDMVHRALAKMHHQS